MADRQELTRSQLEIMLEESKNANDSKDRIINNQKRLLDNIRVS